MNQTERNNSELLLITLERITALTLYLREYNRQWDEKTLKKDGDK